MDPKPYTLTSAISEIRYGSRMDLCDEAVDHAKGLERQITHFMASTSARLRDCLIGGGPASTKEDRERELRLLSEVSSARLAISTAFSDDFDIPSALHAVFGLISRANAHMAEAEGGGAQGGALQTARAQVVSTLGLLGVNLGSGGEAGGGNGALTEQGKIGELLHDVVGFRSKVREAARCVCRTYPLSLVPRILLTLNPKPQTPKDC
jgi:cysteinyl-tRNA synthetase